MGGGGEGVGVGVGLGGGAGEEVGREAGCFGFVAVSRCFLQAFRFCCCQIVLLSVVCACVFLFYFILSWYIVVLYSRGSGVERSASLKCFAPVWSLVMAWRCARCVPSGGSIVLRTFAPPPRPPKSLLLHLLESLQYEYEYEYE